MARMGKWSSLVAGAGLVLVGAGAVGAQAPAPQALENGAQALVQSGNDYRLAAELYRRAAALRAPGDPGAAEDLRTAGLLYVHAGKLAQAQALLERAGERAMAQGDPGEAARAYTDAAFVAARQGKPGKVAVLAHRALWLAGSDAVSAGERALIRNRIGPEMVATLK